MAANPRLLSDDMEVNARFDSLSPRTLSQINIGQKLVFSNPLGFGFDTSVGGAEIPLMGTSGQPLRIGISQGFTTFKQNVGTTIFSVLTIGVDTFVATFGNIFVYNNSAPGMPLVATVNIPGFTPNDMARGHDGTYIAVVGQAAFQGIKLIYTAIGAVPYTVFASLSVAQDCFAVAVDPAGAGIVFSSNAAGFGHLWVVTVALAPVANYADPTVTLASPGQLLLTDGASLVWRATNDGTNNKMVSINAGLGTIANTFTLPAAVAPPGADVPMVDVGGPGFYYLDYKGARLSELNKVGNNITGVNRALTSTPASFTSLVNRAVQFLPSIGVIVVAGLSKINTIDSVSFNQLGSVGWDLTDLNQSDAAIFVYTTSQDGKYVSVVGTPFPLIQNVFRMALTQGNILRADKIVPLNQSGLYLGGDLSLQSTATLWVSEIRSAGGHRTPNLSEGFPSIGVKLPSAIFNGSSTIDGSWSLSAGFNPSIPLMNMNSGALTINAPNFFISSPTLLVSSPSTTFSSPVTFNAIPQFLAGINVSGPSSFSGGTLTATSGLSVTGGIATFSTVSTFNALPTMNAGLTVLGAVVRSTLGYQGAGAGRALFPAGIDMAGQTLFDSVGSLNLGSATTVKLNVPLDMTGQPITTVFGDLTLSPTLDVTSAKRFFGPNDFECTTASSAAGGNAADRGIVLKSNNGSRWLVTVSNAGVLRVNTAPQAPPV